MKSGIEAQAGSAASIVALDRIPIRVEIAKPAHESLVVVWTEALPILNDEQLFYSSADSRASLLHVTGKNTSQHHGLALILTNRIESRKVRI
jgi:hypothetical protein